MTAASGTSAKIMGLEAVLFCALAVSATDRMNVPANSFTKDDLLTIMNFLVKIYLNLIRITVRDIAGAA